MSQLPAQLAERNVTEAQWKTLSLNLYPGANPASVMMVLDYCIARKLDPMKKPCHIVPMQVRNAVSGKSEWRDVVMPGIYEYRTTATRTGLYLGHSKPEYGEAIEWLGETVPLYCDLTVYRWNDTAKMRAEYPVRVLFAEVAGTKKNKETGEISLNERWYKAPIQMLTKCAEAAALREAFPDELGGEATAEEMEGKVIEQDERRTTSTAKLVAQEDEAAGLVDPEAVEAALSSITDCLLDGEDLPLVKVWRSISTETQTAVWARLTSQDRRHIKALLGDHKGVEA